jgi:hypothetical protein
MRWSVSGTSTSVSPVSPGLEIRLPRAHNSHRTYGRGPLSNRSLAINCQDFGELIRAATIIESLRDEAQPKNPSQELQTGAGSGLLAV